MGIAEIACMRSCSLLLTSRRWATVSNCVQRSSRQSLVQSGAAKELELELRPPSQSTTSPWRECGCAVQMDSAQGPAWRATPSVKPRHWTGCPHVDR